MADIEEQGEGILESAPRFRDLDPYDDVDAVMEGSEEAEALEPEPEGLAGKTKEDLFAELKQLRGELAETKARVDPVQSLGQTLQEVLRRQQQPVYQPSSEVHETPEARRKRLEVKYLEDPIGATEEMSREMMRPLADVMIASTTALSKDLAMADPEQKRVYDRWAEEVEREVQTMSPVEKAQNPRVYQAAINRVRGRHQDDVLEERVQAAVAAKLAELGLDTGQMRPKPAVSSLAGRQSSPQPSNQVRKTVIIPRSIQLEAERAGIDPKFLYQHRKEQGLIK